jgi:16S rRNA (uracil1498-N3)-methyltransferase
LFLFYQPEILRGANYLDPDESHHAAKVLRLKAGDTIQIADGTGIFYEALLKKIQPGRCEFDIIKKTVVPRRHFQIHLALSPTKNADRTEWFVEKAIELGVERISFMTCKNSERKALNMERIKKLSIAASKQSRQAWMADIADLCPLHQILSIQADQRFIAAVDPHNPELLKNKVKPGSSYLMLIGPEGDFTPEELDQAQKAGFLKVSLGPNRLRTETAGIAACHILNILNE